MEQIEADALADATRDIRLPDGAALTFVPVGTVAGVVLPEVIRRSAPRRQASFAAGRLAAQAALRKAGFTGATELGIDDDGLPVWPRGWLGSISHTDDVAAALTAPVLMGPTNGMHLLGLDIERIVTAEIAAEIGAEIAPELPVDPNAAIHALDVTRAFSAKEALYKALYPGIRQFREFSAAHVSLGSNPAEASVHADLVLTQNWGPNWPAGTSFRAAQRIAAGHVATILGF